MGNKRSRLVKQVDQRVVLLGKEGAGKSSLADRILGHEISKTEEIGLCRRKKGKFATRKLTVVDTPGWDRVSVQRTPENIKEEIIQSATLCLPGPHALLLVLPISMHDQIPSANEIKSASHHVALLSHRAWRHTIVLFVCKDEMDTSAIDQQVQGAKKLIDKCEGRYFILHNDSDVTALLQKIDYMVQGNRGDFLMPQVSYVEFEKRMQRIAEQIGMNEKRVEELKQQQTRESEKMELDIREQIGKYEKRVEELEQLYRRKIEKMELDFREQLGKLEINYYKTGGTTKRSDSKEFLPPAMAETSQGGAAVQHQDSVKEMGAENEEPDKRMPSGTAEQTEMYEKREEDLKQQEREFEMELDFSEQPWKQQEIHYYKIGGPMMRSHSSEYLPQTSEWLGLARVELQSSIRRSMSYLGSK